MNTSIQDINQPKHSVFLDYLQVLYQRKWTVIICLLGILIPVILLNYLLTPVYEAEAAIIYEEPQDTMFALDVGQPFYNKSAVINLTEQVKSLSIAIEVAQTLPQEVIQLYEVPKSIPPDFTKEYFIARHLQNNLIISSVRGSDIIRIKIEANDPTAAKVIANTYVERILDWNLRKKRQETSNVRNFIEQQLVVFQDKLNEAEEALKTFKETNKMVSLSDASTEILNRITEIEVNYDEARTERMTLEQRKEYIDHKNKKLYSTLSLSAISSPYATQLKQKLDELEIERSSYKVKGNNISESDVAALNEKIEQTKEELVNELLGVAQRKNLVDTQSQIRNLLQESITLEVDLETYKVKEEALKKILEDYEGRLKNLPKQELSLARLVRSRDVNNKIYSLLLEKLQEARITEASKVGDIRVVDPAAQPIFPVKPDKIKNMILGFLLGLGLGVGLAFFLDSLDASVKSQEDVEKHTDLAVLASIPIIHTNGPLTIMKKNQHRKHFYQNKLLPGIEKTSSVFDAYRSLQINFAFVNTDKVRKTILLTSAGAGEGKTLTSINMSYIFANSGSNVALIDCDLRRPMVHEILNINQTPGLTDVLVKKLDLSSAVKTLDNTNFSVITSGTLPPNPSEILGSKRMCELLAELKNEYDLLILDGPPIIPVIDSVILGKEVDGVCLVIRSGRTSYDALRKAKQLLENSQIDIIGTILNSVNFKTVYGYYKDYYYYEHKKKKRKKKKTVFSA